MPTRFVKFVKCLRVGYFVAGRGKAFGRMILEFEDCELNTDRYELKRQGNLCKVEPKAFDLLVFLAKNADRVVSRDEIIDEIWDGRVVSEATISTCIKTVRTAVGDNGKDQRVIRTVHGRGFRFVGESPSEQAAVAPDPAAVADKPSIAVLPFNNMSGDLAQEHFCDGLTEDIITTLSKISKLFVIARNSTFVYKGRAVDVKQVGREQGVKYVLEGSVRNDGRRIRTTAQLIDAATGHHLWAERFDRDSGDVFTVQDEITKEIVSALQIELTEGEQARLAARGTSNVDAWQLTFQGRTLVHEHVEDSVAKALGLLEKALARDENYALAWGALAEGHWTQWLNDGWSASREASLDAALAASDRAMALDPQNADILAMRSLIIVSYQRFDEALALARQVDGSAHNQANALAIAAITLRVCGAPGQAIAQLERAVRHCPVCPAWFSEELAKSHWALEQFEEAIRAAQLAIQSDPGFSYPYVMLAMSYAELGQQQEAEAAVRSVLQLDPASSVRAWTERLPYKDPAMMLRERAALLKAGMPA